MCTTIILIRPENPLPVVIASIRDEFRDRLSCPPKQWWSKEFPNAIGGKDGTAGGTWLAINSRSQRVAIVLNRRINCPKTNIRTRGILPLLAVTQKDFTLNAKKMTGFHPFNLLCSSLDKSLWWRWDGTSLGKQRLGSGLHMLTGKDLNDINNDSRQQHWLPIFQKAQVPNLSESSDFQIDWGDWQKLITDSNSKENDPTALNVKGVANKSNFGTVSASLVAFTANKQVRYCFCSAPIEQQIWQQIL
jgi:hypothetical protein